MTTDTGSGYPRVIGQALNVLDPLVTLYKPFVDGLHHLPADGRFLIVGNHTHGGGEALLIPYFVHRRLGTRVRPLVDRQFGATKGLGGELLAALGAVVGSPDAAGELMSDDETILVFPGGGREVSKGRDQLYTLLWQGRTGFARLAAEHDYPVVPASLVGGDDIFHILTSSDGPWARLTKPLAERLTGRTDMPLQLMRGIGPTLIPRPQRMYLRFGAPIDTTRPKRLAADGWALTVRDQVKAALESDMAALQAIRATDPYRRLAPWAWRSAASAEDRAASGASAAG